VTMVQRMSGISAIQYMTFLSQHRIRGLGPVTASGYSATRSSLSIKTNFAMLKLLKLTKCYPVRMRVVVTLHISAKIVEPIKPSILDVIPDFERTQKINPPPIVFCCHHNLLNKNLESRILQNRFQSKCSKKSHLI